jgi:DNA-binding response OmpR family regulator
MSEEMKRKILLVDDDKSIRVTLSEALSAAGYDVATAVDGEHALEKFPSDVYDLVLLDMKMPGVQGMEVLRQVKAMKSGQPVVMMTGFGTVETAVEALKLGAIDYIQKPFSPDEIRSIVRRVIERRSLEENALASFDQIVEFAKKCIVEHDLEKAYGRLKEAVRLDPTKPEPFNLMGAINEINGDIAGAQKMYRAALALDPSYEPALANLDRTVFGRTREPVQLDRPARPE